MKYDERVKETIYDIMNGSFDLEDVPVPEFAFVDDEFAAGKPCAELYKQIYHANLRLCKRLGVQEDPDVETIINCSMEITKICSMKMFDYGARIQSMPEGKISLQ